jgi:hypothetical protein
MSITNINITIRCHEETIGKCKITGDDFGWIDTMFIPHKDGAVLSISDIDCVVCIDKNG